MLELDFDILAFGTTLPVDCLDTTADTSGQLMFQQKADGPFPNKPVVTSHVLIHHP